jgi:hypothetical protein
MDPKAVIKAAEQVIRSNSPAILAGLGISGLVGTAYLSHRSGYTLGRQLQFDEEHGSPTPTFKEVVRKHWKSYIPPVMAGLVTGGCIIGAVKIGNRRTAALTAAYSLSEKAFSEYKEKVTEKLGIKKEQNVRDEIAQDKVTKAAISRDTVLVGEGNVLCYELHTGRPFLCTIEKLRKAMNDVNFRVLNQDYATLSEFYYMVGLSPTSSSSDFGWTSDKPMELEFSTTMAEETRPCIAFEYNYLKAL